MGLAGRLEPAEELRDIELALFDLAAPQSDCDDVVAPAILHPACERLTLKSPVDIPLAGFVRQVGEFGPYTQDLIGGIDDDRIFQGLVTAAAVELGC